MKLSVFFLLSYLTVFHAVSVESGVIFDKIKSGVSNTRKSIGCGIQKFGGVIGHNSVNCGNNGDEQSNTVESHEETEEKRKFLYLR